MLYRIFNKQLNSSSEIGIQNLFVVPKRRASQTVHLFDENDSNFCCDLYVKAKFFYIAFERLSKNKLKTNNINNANNYPTTKAVVLNVKQTGDW